MRLLAIIALLAALGAAGFFMLTAPQRVDAAAFDGIEGDAARGERMFFAAGCASCHAAPGAEGEDRLVLAGGERLPTPFGTFVAPNISPHPEAGIGGWSVADLAGALWHGVSPSGRHYYPSFPYTSYARMSAQDVADLHAYLAALPVSDAQSAPHELGFPFTIRRGLGLWKLLNTPDEWVMAGDLEPQLARGRYLVEGPGHCAECHTPRDATGGLDRDRWMAGGPNPTGEGRIPGLTPAQLDWSAGDIAYYLETGFTPEFDSAGGHMAKVVGNLARLPAEDRQAIAAYIKALAPRS